MKGDKHSLAKVHQALMSEEEKRGLYKSKDGGDRVDKDETGLVVYTVVCRCTVDAPQ